MGLFDIFNKTGNKSSDKAFSFSDKLGDKYADSSTIAEDERPFYQPDSYYTLIAQPGTAFEKRVISFEERKRTTFPSSNGLYVAEILLLEYCSYGKYPKPTSGYPGFWWFEYGIRDIGHALESLYQRGFLRWTPKLNAIKALKVDELKEILQIAGLPTIGKKADLIERIKNEIPENQLELPSYVPKYELTELGQEELERNGYVVYMQKHPHKTTEDSRFGPTFTVWDINKLFPDGDASNWKEVVGKLEKKRFGVNIANSTAKEVPSQKEDISKKAEEMRKFLQSKQDVIAKKIKTGGDGFAEESKGLDYKRVGQDKEALIQFYISIGKNFDAPALYTETAKLLKKYGLYKEAIEVLDTGLNNVPENNWHRKEIDEMKQKLLLKL